MRVACAVLCGVVVAAALAAAAAAGHGRATRCGRRVVHAGAITGTGCWRATPNGWASPTPVTLDGLTLGGQGRVALDARRGSIASSGSVRWLFGSVQVRRAPFAFHGGTLTFAPSGAVRGMPFRGSATLAFTRANGGTALLSAQVGVPLVAGGVAGSVTLAVSSAHGLDVRRLQIAVTQFPLSRLVLKQLAFAYISGAWTADAAVSLPGFLPSDATARAHIVVAHGRLSGIGLGVNGVQIPLTDGFFLTGADFSVSPFDPLGIGGDATGTVGPPLGGAGAIRVRGTFAYTSKSPESWRAGGDVTLPWLSAFTPKVSGTVSIEPGRAMTFHADADLTVHHWGVKGSVDGFVTRRAFNAEGKAKLSFPLFGIGANALFSSKGMAACGKIFFGPHVGFGYSWGGALHIMDSSCDVGPWRVTRGVAAAVLGAQTIPIENAVPFEVFAAKGTNVTISGPSGTFDSTADRDGPDAFVVHDPDTGWVYVVVPAPQVGIYAVDPIGTGTITGVQAADGLADPEISGNVTAGATSDRLDYGIGGLVPGETVSFFQGQSQTTAGAEPIAEDVSSNGGGTATFAPEPLGTTNRFAYAVVSIDGKPRSQQLVAGFGATPVAGPSLGSVFITQRASTPPEWGVSIKPVRNVQHVVADVLADDGTHTYLTLPSAGPAAVAPADRHVVVTLTPYDTFGRAGLPWTCDSAKPGACAPA